MNLFDKGDYGLLRRYMAAIKMYIQQYPAVAGIEPASVTAVAVCSDNPYQTHIPKRKRTCMRHTSSKRGVVSDFKRRRQYGAGKPRGIASVRDMLLFW